MKERNSSSTDIDVELNPNNAVKSCSYYIIKKGDIKGLVYDNLSKKKEFLYDDFLKYENLRLKDNGLFTVELGKPDEVEKKGKITIEKFKSKFKGSSEPDSLYWHYSKELTDVDFSFNPALDQKPYGKLWKVSLIYNPKPALKLARKEIFWQFKRKNSNDFTMLRNYFGDFIIERKKRNLQ